MFNNKLVIRRLIFMFLLASFILLSTTICVNAGLQLPEDKSIYLVKSELFPKNEAAYLDLLKVEMEEGKIKDFIPIQDIKVYSEGMDIEMDHQYGVLEVRTTNLGLPIYNEHTPRDHNEISILSTENPWTKSSYLGHFLERTYPIEKNGDMYLVSYLSLIEEDKERIDYSGDNPRM